METLVGGVLFLGGVVTVVRLMHRHPLALLGALAGVGSSLVAFVSSKEWDVWEFLMSLVGANIAGVVGCFWDDHQEQMKQSGVLLTVADSRMPRPEDVRDGARQ
ncbi:hypothetical protein [Myxococcus stipitatus]|uniref:hypothetical protein n=1 Tax=Myxococcus stipitatus TaxID=83455 RepID=UPI0030D3501B